MERMLLRSYTLQQTIRRLCCSDCADSPGQGLHPEWGPSCFCAGGGLGGNDASEDANMDAHKDT